MAPVPVVAGSAVEVPLVAVWFLAVAADATLGLEGMMVMVALEILAVGSLRSGDGTGYTHPFLRRDGRVAACTFSWQDLADAVGLVARAVTVHGWLAGSAPLGGASPHPTPSRVAHLPSTIPPPSAATSLQTREGFTPEQINEASYVDINGNKAVFDSLRNNHKVHYDGKRFWYKSKHDLNGKDGLLSLIRKFPEGLAVVDVRDSYPTVMDDLQALKTAGQVWLLSNMDSQEDIVYPNDPKITIKVDDDLKLLFRSIELPRDMVDIEKDLQKNGMKPATNTVQRRAKAQVHGAPTKPKQKKKKHEISKRTKLTNAHLPELFQMK